MTEIIILVDFKTWTTEQKQALVEEIMNNGNWEFCEEQDLRDYTW